MFIYNLKLPVFSMPSRKRRSSEAPLASGVASVTVPALKVLSQPPPSACVGGCSNVVPCTVTFDVPLPHGARSTVTTTDVDVLVLTSATAVIVVGIVEMSMTWKRSRVTLPPLLFVSVRRMSNVPNVELFAGSLVWSRTRLGGVAAPTQGSSKAWPKDALRWIGEDRFSGEGAPNAGGAPPDAAFVLLK